MSNEYICGGGRGICKKGWHTNHYTQLNVCDYMADVPNNTASTDLVEGQFKNTRKGYFHNSNNLDLQKGDIVAVEGNPGHDIGTVTMTGALVALQVKKANLKSEDDIKRIYRLAKDVDLEKYEQAKAREHLTMIESRQIAKGLGLEMKIGDVEYQGDGNKAIFYYLADGRVDFRELVKDLAANLHTRIELRQIGVRDEAKMLGGLGICGQPYCCKRFLNDFQTVSIKMAKEQGLSLNPTKVSGSCGRLMCCLKYEQDAYDYLNAHTPRVGSTVKTPEGIGTVTDVNLISGNLFVKPDDSDSIPYKINKKDVKLVSKNKKSSETKSENEKNV